MPALGILVWREKNFENGAFRNDDVMIKMIGDCCVLHFSGVMWAENIDACSNLSSVALL